MNNNSDKKNDKFICHSSNLMYELARRNEREKIRIKKRRRPVFNVYFEYIR